MPNNLSKLDLIVVDDYIQNLNEVISFLRVLDLDFNSCEYLETLVNKLRYANIKNKEELVSLIDSRIFAFKIQEQKIELSNSETLKMLQEYNSDLKKIVVIETKKDKNDSLMDIDYVMIIRKSETEMLVCEDNILNTIVKNNPQTATMTAEDLFNYFKEFMPVKLKFYPINEFDQISKNNEYKAIINDQKVLETEFANLNKYKRQFNLDGDIKLSIDSNGERIYVIEDVVIKFYFNSEKKRVINVLKRPDLDLNNDFLSDMNDAYDKTEVFDNEVIEAIRVQAYEKSEELPNIFDINTLKEILIKRDVYELEINSNEQKYIEYAINHLIDTMMERAENNLLVSDEQNVLDDYMGELIKQNDENEKELSQKEKELIKKYLSIKEEMEIKGYHYESIEHILKNDINHSNGVANIIMLLEIVIIGMMVLMFLSLDI